MAELAIIASNVTVVDPQTLFLDYPPESTTGHELCHAEECLNIINDLQNIISQYNELSLFQKKET